MEINIYSLPWKQPAFWFLLVLAANNFSAFGLLADAVVTNAVCKRVDVFRNSFLIVMSVI
jgi:hypothetical protein